jgi:hypothetical protein
VREAAARTTTLRAQIERTARQARAFLDRYGHRLPPADRRFLDAYARLPDRPFLRRKLDIARLRVRRELGFWRNVGVLLRG